MTTNYDMLPEHMRDAARRYVENGYAPGHFLTAVLENNLVEAAARADEENQRALFQWASWLYNHVPTPAWGSSEKVTEWILAHEREQATVEEPAQ